MEHSTAAVQALLSCSSNRDLIFVQTDLLKRFDDQFALLTDAAKLAEEQKDESKARARARGPARRRWAHASRLQVKALRAQVEALVQAHEKLQLHTEALQQLKSSCATLAARGHRCASSSRAGRPQVSIRRAAH
jgi:hypothetical protein